MPPKRIWLSLDTTAASCAAALICDGEVVATRIEAMKVGQAERLFPMIADMIGDAQIDFPQVTDIAVATGPGNFTGIRIGVAAARGLGLSTGARVVGISVLEALAHKRSGPALSTLDARGSGLYCQLFEDGVPMAEPRIDTLDDIAKYRQAGLFCAGFQADRIAEVLGAKGFDGAMPGPAVFGQVAMTGRNVGLERPAPLYIRAADAALPMQPPPRIVP